MGWLEDLGNNLGLGDLDRGQNEFRDVDRESFNLPGFSERDAYLNRTSRDFLGREAPQAAESEFRRYQGRNLDRLNRLASGEDSYTAGQLQLAQDQMARQQMGMAAGAAPGAGAGARRAAMQNIARGNQGLAFNQAQAGIAERQAAIAALGQQSAAARAQDLQRGEFNVGAQQNQTGMNQQGWTAAQQLALQNAQNQQQGGFQYENQRGNRFSGLLTQPTTGERALGAITGAAQAGMAAFGGPGGTAAASSALSSPGYTPQQFGQPMQLQTGPDAVPYAPSAQGVGYTPGAYNVPMRLAEGGIVTQPTRALVGEAGPEAVIPLPYLPELISKLSLASDRQQYDRAMKDQGREGLIKPGTYSEPSGRFYHDARGEASYEALRNRLGLRPAPVEPQPDVVISPEEAGILPQGRVSVISHERDKVAERPFLAAAMAQTAQEEAEAARREAASWQRYAAQAYSQNRGR